MNLNRKQLLMIRDALATRRETVWQHKDLRKECIGIELAITEQLDSDIRVWELVPEETDGTE